MELLGICQNCNNFFQDPSDMTGTLSLGICVLNKDFEPYLDDIFGEGDFSTCWELYIKYRFTGQRNACEDYDEFQVVEDNEEDRVYSDYEAERLLEQIRNTNVDEVIKYFYSDNFEYVKRAFYTIEKYVFHGNEDAQNGLIEFYRDLGPAEELDDVHLRVKILNTLSFASIETNQLDLYIKELLRTPSNNRTRQLYTLILDKLAEYPVEELEELILNLLEKKKFAPKMEKRLLDLLEEDHWTSPWD